MKNPENCIIVIFGASGDLTKRKLLPSLYDLFCQNLLPEKFAVVGASRSTLDDNTFRERMLKGIESFANNHLGNKAKLKNFVEKLYYFPIDTFSTEDYFQLKDYLIELDKKLGTGENFIYYLSTPPILYGIIPENLCQTGLNQEKNGQGWKRLVIEKPFGNDLVSARELNRKLLHGFEESQIYRIDHYLGKETVQNLIVTRFSNGIFEPLWNRNYVHHVEITAAESIGVENRGGYYDGSGALRDMVQNHLLQLLGLVAMEPPSVIHSTSIRNEVLKVFQSLRPFNDKTVRSDVIRGQYVESSLGKKKIKAYRQEKGVEKKSRIETFVALKCYIDNWRWAGIPFYIRTGKRLPTRVTEIVVHFKTTPHHLFVDLPEYNTNYNQLVIRIQPDEGVLLKIGMKVPGAGFHVRQINMDFHYKDLTDIYLPNAYERLLLDCMLGDSTLYTRGDALEEAWKFVQPIQEAWSNDPVIKVHGYPAGTWGPEIADNLIEEEQLTWRYPCKNLASDGVYCEL